MPNINFKHPNYELTFPKWEIVTDCCNGSMSVKSKGSLYLPKPNPTDTSDENLARFKQYLFRAVFYNVTASTLTGLVGQVFAKDSLVDVPASLEGVKADADGANISLEQQAKQTLEYTVSNGRAGLLVDYPEVEGVVTRQDQLDGLVRPNILNYPAQSIINWRTERIGAENKLTLVVIAETVLDDVDGYEFDVRAQYRVLHLIDGVYSVEIFVSGIEDEAEFELTDSFTPLDSNGNPLTEIPFTFVGSSNNDPEVDNPPLYDLAVLNLAHYCNSADYEESSYISGQPTLYLTGLTNAWVTEVLKGEIQIGSRAAIMLPENGGAGMVQAEANSMPFEAMQLKERQMVALGAKLVEQKSVQRTATEASIEATSAVSILASAANNVGEAYTQALTWCGLFVGDTTESSVSLNTDFDIDTLSAQDQQALLTLWQNDVLTFDEIRDRLKRGKIATLDNDEARDIIEADALNDNEEELDDEATFENE